MVSEIQQFDVCIVCALAEEAKALLLILRDQCASMLEERISPRYRYVYRSAALKNAKGELLNLHISWLPHVGLQEMTLHFSYVLEEYQPCIAIMTGICAGDAREVQLGDLIVAERTFTYDNGKFTLDDDGRTVHQHDTMTYQPDANILQFLALFEDWKPLVARLKRPPSPPENRLERRGIRCHLKAMASGSAVRADHPFEDVRAPVRGTVAIDMESAAFGLVMSRYPLIPWLVVKGVCNYADQDKNDIYHDYAARASALYALSFIRAYVTGQRLLGSSSRVSRESKDSRSIKNVANVSDMLETLPGRDGTAQQDPANLLDVSANTIQHREADKNREADRGVPLAQQKVFISYSHKDMKWLERLRIHLTPLEREGIIDLWDDTKIVAGAQWKEAISKALETARVAITLVSADFLASDFIAQHELPNLLSRAADGGTVIIPIIISPCLFNETGLKIFQTVNPPDKPLTAMKLSDREHVWVKVAEIIKKRLTIDEM